MEISLLTFRRLYWSHTLDIILCTSGSLPFCTMQKWWLNLRWIFKQKRIHLYTSTVSLIWLTFWGATSRSMPGSAADSTHRLAVRNSSHRIYIIPIITLLFQRAHCPASFLQFIADFPDALILGEAIWPVQTIFELYDSQTPMVPTLFVRVEWVTVGIGWVRKGFFGKIMTAFIYFSCFVGGKYIRICFQWPDAFISHFHYLLRWLWLLTYIST